MNSNTKKIIDLFENCGKLSNETRQRINAEPESRTGNQKTETNKPN